MNPELKEIVDRLQTYRINAMGRADLDLWSEGYAEAMSDAIEEIENIGINLMIHYGNSEVTEIPFHPPADGKKDE